MIAIIYITWPSWPWSYGSWIYNYLCNRCPSPLMLWLRLLPRARCTTLCDKVCQWLAAGRLFSLGPPVSTTNKTEILWKVALNTIKPNQNKLHYLVIEWMLFNATWPIFSCFIARTNYNQWNDDDGICFVIEQPTCSIWSLQCKHIETTVR